jgi:ADP-heptose:LPS heptosyltransferase
VVLYGGMGDCLNDHYNIFAGIKREYKNPEVTLLISGWTNKNPLVNSPFVDEHLIIEDVKNFWENKDAHKLKGRHFDAVYMICHHAEPYDLLRHITFDKLIIYYGHEMYAKVVPPDILVKATKVGGYYLSAGLSYKCPYFFVDDDFKRMIKYIDSFVKDRKIMCFVPFSSSSNRDIPMNKIEEIINRYYNEYAIIVPATLSKHMYIEYRGAEWLKRLEEFEKSDKAIVIIDRPGDEKLGIGGLSALIETADLLISTHTGTVPLSSLFNTPTIAVSDNIQPLSVRYRSRPFVNIRVNRLANIKIEYIDQAIEILKKQSKYNLSFKEMVELDYSEEKINV